MMLSAAERRELLDLARTTIAARLSGAPPPPDPPNLPVTFSGAFVTLHVGGDLRGCIGYPAADRPIADVVRQCAISAALDDPRFCPLAEDELPHVTIEISVLGPLEPVSDISEIEVGRHGLILSSGSARGLLLPQVASEHGWTRAVFLSQTCVKAGLPPDAWRRGARITRFEADVFSEADPLVA